MPNSFGDNLKSVRELIDERPEVDNTATYAELCTIQDELWSRLAARFTLRADPSTERFQPYASSDGSASGTLKAFSGPDVDWAVYGRIGNPAKSFCNLYINVWLGPQIRVPHLMFQFGTFPMPFFFMDYTPRVHFLTNPGYMDRYYEPANGRFIELMKHPGLQPFYSQSTYVRAFLSPVALCFIAHPDTEGLIELVKSTSHEFLDRWLGWVDDAEPVRPNEYGDLSKRDLELRRHAAERDPANVVPVRIYGTELASGVVRALWGGERQLPRPPGVRS